MSHQKQRVGATIRAYAKEQNALILELEEPLAEAVPLRFSKDTEPPFWSLSYLHLNAEWTMSLQPLGGTTCVGDKRKGFVPLPSPGLIVDRNGAVTGACMNEELILGSSWKGTPLNWPLISATEMGSLLQRLEQICSLSLLKVTMHFRSPRNRPGGMWAYHNEREQETVQNAIGILVDKQRIMVLAGLSSGNTARLEQILVHHPAHKEALGARFVHSLSDYGSLIGELERPLDHAVPFSLTDIRDLRHQLLLSADVKVSGERRTVYLTHERINTFESGRKGMAIPELPGGSESTFLFDLNGSLAAMPLIHRDKIAVRTRYSSEHPVLTGAGILDRVLGDLAKHSDPANVPVAEEEEMRLAWMGIELQPMTPQLAQINQVAHLTGRGENGAIVTHVYPGSPAAEAGIEPGFILLRLHLGGQPKPIDVRMEMDMAYQDMGFPWEQLDELPEEYFDQIPVPWPSAENSLRRNLTEIGLGTSYRAEIYHSGKLVFRDFTVEQGPPNYRTASRHTAEELGITVRDLTYEVRHYLQRRSEEPGVVVSRVEPGDKASVSGIRPYEIITHINDSPVMDVEGFAQLVDGQRDLRISIKRMSTGRIVKMRI